MKKNQSKKTIFIVSTFPIKKERDQFITHIPIRIKKILGDNIDVFFLYAGDIKEGILISNEISPVKLFDTKFNTSGNFFIKQIFQQLFILHLFFKLKNEVKKKQPYLIINMNLHLYNIVFGILGKMYNVKTVARITGDHFYNRPKSLSKYLLYKYKKFLEVLSLTSMDKIICLSNDLAKKLPKKQTIQKKIEIASPGIETEKFTLNENVKKDIDIIFIGRMEPIKNLDYAFKIYKELKDKHPSINFHLFGTGVELQSLIDMHKDEKNIVFHGEIPHNEIVNYLHRSKVLLLISHSEGFPNVVLEAMVCKVLVAVTPMSDMVDIIGDNKNGILLEYNKPVKSASIISNFLQNDKKRKEITENAFQYAKENHSYDTLRKKYRKILLEEKSNV
jgi:glycosyltransferase involved in cell wall biosynthesis